MTLASRTIVVERPIAEVYDDWADVPSLSRRLGDDVEVEPIADRTLRWTLPIGVRRHEVVVREITASDHDLVWLSLAGPRLAGRLSFRPLGRDATAMRLSVDFDPRDPLGWLAGSLGVPDRAIEHVLEAFKRSVESEAVQLRGDDAPSRGPDYEILDHPRPSCVVDLRGPSLRDESQG